MSITILLGFSILRVESLGFMNSQSPKKIVFIGDSITILQSSLGYSYVDKLAECEYWNGTNITNSARSGNSIRNYYNNDYWIESHILDHNPDWLFINLGLADVAYYGNASQFKIEYQWLVNKVLEEQPNITILPIKFTWTSSLQTSSMEAHLSVIDDIAEDFNLTTIDLYNHTYLRTGLFRDGTHPNVNGVSVIVDVIVDTLAPIMDPNYVPPTSTETESLSSSQTTNVTTFPLIAICVTITIIGFYRRKKLE